VAPTTTASSEIKTPYDYQKWSLLKRLLIQSHELHCLIETWLNFPKIQEGDLLNRNIKNQHTSQWNFRHPNL
jgi:hypothetical protein